jgi:integrase
MPEKKIKYLSKQEIERFFEAIKNPRDRAVFAFIYYYGLRVSEATLITLEDIDWCKEKIYIRRVKSGLSGEKPLSPRIKEIFKEYLKIRQKTGQALFTGRQGNLSCARIAQLFKEYA